MNINSYVVPASDGQDLLENIRIAMDKKPKLAVYLKRWYSNEQLKVHLRNEHGNVHGINTLLKIPLAKMKSTNEIYSYFIELLDVSCNSILAMITITPNRTLPVIRVKVTINL